MRSQRSTVIAAAALGAVIVAVGVLRPAIVRGVLGSPRAILIVVGIIAAAVGVSALLRRRGTPDPVRLGILALLLVPVLGLTVAPYFAADEVVDEALPGLVVPGQVAPAVAAGPAPQPSPQPTPQDDPSLEEATVEGSAQVAAVDATPSPARTVPDTPDEDVLSTPSGPVELSRGTFVGLDGHTASGEAALYDVDDMLLVRLDGVDLQRVPDAHVYLVPTADATSPVEGAVYLGPLTGNVGSSNYQVPAGTVIGQDVTVLVWCEAFASPVGGATQSPSA